MNRRKPVQPLLLLLATGLGGLPLHAQTATTAAAQAPQPAPQPTNLAIASLPSVNKPARQGVGLDLSMVWPDAEFGYAPIRIRARAIRNSARDRRVEIRFRTSHWRGNLMEVSGSFVLPGNNATAEMVLPVPKYGEWNSGSWDVWIDGRYAQELSAEQGGIPSSAGASHLEIAKVVMLLGPNQTLPPVVAVAATSQQTPQLAAVPSSEMPQRWLDYSTRDIVVLSSRLLFQLPTSQPQQWRALRQWVAVGGNLVVLQPGDGPLSLAAVDELLDGNGPADVAGGEHDGWEEIEVEGLRGQVQEVHEWLEQYGNRTYQVGPGGNRVPVTQGSAGGTPAPPPATDKLASIQLQGRDFHFGQVLLQSDGEALLPYYAFAAWKTEPRARRCGWSWRHGLRPDAGTGDFWNLLVPGVGMAPVGIFRGLITLFVLVIGPLNFWFFQRRGQLHLLLLTVPAGAAVITIALFLYALVSEGLATRARVRSYTMLDVERGEAYSWSRNSLYAGLAPGRGLRLPLDALALPLMSGTSSQLIDDREQISRSMAWGKEQRLNRGWLRSRTPTQYVMLRATSSAARLEIERRDEQILAHNRLGATILALQVRDRQGKLYVGPTIPQGASEPLQASEPAAVHSQWFAAGQAVAPRYPLAISSRDHSLFGIQQSQDRDRLGTVSAGSGLASGRLNDLLLQTIDRAPEPIPQGSFRALLDRDPAVPIGVDAPREEQSWHVIAGPWLPWTPREGSGGTASDEQR